MITNAALLSVAPAARPYLDPLLRGMERKGITTNNRAAHFLGNIHVESGGFKHVRESLNYAFDSDMMRKFIKWGRISHHDAQQFGRTDDHPANQSALANILYGGIFGREELGNVQPGDGWLFRGRGLKQLTGRDNYTRFARDMGDKYLRDPDLVALPEGAVDSALWFWSSKPALNRLADADNYRGVCVTINGGETALDERIRWTKAFKAAFMI